MRIERIRLKNYKIFRDVTLDSVPAYCVLVGANGVGKSTLFDVFGFLRDCLKSNVRSALLSRGGFREVVSRGHVDETIQIELQLRMQMASKMRLVTYYLEIGYESGQVFVEREILRYKRGVSGAPFHFLDFSRGAGKAITNESEFATDLELTVEPQTLGAPDMLAISGLGQFQRFIAASAFRNLIENWHVSDFRIHAARGSKDAGFAEHLSTEGDNLPLVTQYLFESHRKTFDRILEVMKRRVPGVGDVDAKSTEDGRIVLRFHDGAFKDPFVSRYVSDGTIKMFAYLTLLYDPSPHPLLCVEEPENQLYPTLLGELSEEFEAYAKRGGQVFVSTHSPDFLNRVPLPSIFVLRKIDGFTKFTRANADANLVAFTKGGDLPGQLWRQGMFSGADPA
jgi:predicted ATPase